MDNPGLTRNPTSRCISFASNHVEGDGPTLAHKKNEGVKLVYKINSCVRK